MLVKTSELTGLALDWAVAKAQGNKYGSVTFDPYTKRVYETLGLMQAGYDFRPSTDWKTGGPIIEREHLCLMPILEDDDTTSWAADKTIDKLFDQNFTGPTPLIAAMRCYVDTRLGDTVEIPSELA